MSVAGRTIAPIPRTLRRLRLLRGMKQSHVAELVGMTQPTVSRWERGVQRPSEDELAAVLDILCDRAAPAGDAALRRLVETSSRPVHLICDATPRLLAAAPRRLAGWRRPVGDLLGRSLLPFASPEIVAAEDRLAGARPPAMVFSTGPNADESVAIAPGIVLWEWLRLDDGSAARLVTTLGPAEPAPPYALAA